MFQGTETIISSRILDMTGVSKTKRFAEVDVVRICYVEEDIVKGMEK